VGEFYDIFGDMNKSVIEEMALLRNKRRAT
jgi:hypothetical protein